MNRGAPCRILVVDDEEPIRILLGQILGDAGYAVATASSGREAIDSLEREHFSLVITDMVMADLNGAQVLEVAKRLHTEMPAIVITGYPSEETPHQLAALGVSEYITKPFNVDAITLTVAKLLG